MSLKRHTLQNLAGALAPMVVAIVTVPLFLHSVGVARYGMLSLVWLVVGYFGLFDFGLARATAYHVARLHEGDEAERSRVFLTAAALNLALGLAGAVILYLALPELLDRGFHVQGKLAPEMGGTRMWIAAAVPMATLNGVALGALEGRQRFDLLNFCSGLTAFGLQLAPLGVALLLGPSLALLVPAVVMARAASLAGTMAAAARVLPLHQDGLAPRRGHMRQLLRYGGWITVSSVAGNLLVAADRLLIGGCLGVVAVSFYTVPYNLVTRASILPGAVATSLFPRLSREADAQSAAMARHAVLTLAGVFTPAVVAGLLALPLFMRLWVGAGFAAHATPVALVLLAGVWINGLAFVPFSRIQAGDRASRTAWLHVVELPLFLALLWVGLHAFGLLGAAAAWTFRAGADAVMVFWLAGMGRDLWRLWPGAVAVSAAALAARVTPLSPDVVVAVGILACTVLWARHLAPGLTLKMLLR